MADNGQPLILVLDDDPDVREVIADLLGTLGYEPVQAETGEAALRLVALNDRIRLLLTDVRMPGMDGFEVARVARIIRPSLKVLYLTGYVEETADEYDSEDIIQKPVRVEALAERVEHALGRHR